MSEEADSTFGPKGSLLLTSMGAKGGQCVGRLSAPLLGEAVGLTMGSVIAPLFADGALSFGNGGPSFAGIGKEAEGLMLKSRGGVLLGY